MTEPTNEQGDEIIEDQDAEPSNNAPPGEAPRDQDSDADGQPDNVV